MQMDVGRLELFAYIDGEPAEDDLESLSCVQTEVSATLGEDVKVIVTPIRVDWPTPIPQHERGGGIYRRREYLMDETST